MKKLIFIACDTDNTVRVKKIIAQTQTNKLDIGYKFGLEFTLKMEENSYQKLNKKIFLDLKLNDIPETCSKSIKSLKDLKNINYISLHANSGEETIKAVVKTAKKTKPNMKILLVTVLTSISNTTIRKIGHTKPIKEL